MLIKLLYPLPRMCPDLALGMNDSIVPCVLLDKDKGRGHG
jgi:hypothetical protein